MLLPCCGLLEKLSYRLIPETDHPDTAAVLDERLFATPAIALVKSGGADQAHGRRRGAGAA